MINLRRGAKQSTPKSPIIIPYVTYLPQNSFNTEQISPGVYTLLIEEYVPLFKKYGVTAVVRFNKKMYDRNALINGGINHYDMYYEDGGNPTEEIAQRFLQVCEAEKGAVAIHCKVSDWQLLIIIN